MNVKLALLPRRRTLLAGLLVPLLAIKLLATPVDAPFTPDADAWASSSTNFTNSNYLESYNASKWTYLRFKVTGVTGKITAVKLRLYLTSIPNSGITTVYAADNGQAGTSTFWGETATWANRPYRAPAVYTSATADPAADGAGYVNFPITDYISGDGVYTFALTSSDYKQYQAKNYSSGARAPQLVVTHQEGVDEATSLSVDLWAKKKAFEDRYHRASDGGGASANSLLVKYGVIDATKQPYGALHDGTTDDRLAIQRAIHDAQLAHAAVYLPAGTYLVGDTIEMVQGAIDEMTGRLVDLTDEGSGSRYVQKWNALGFTHIDAMPDMHKERWFDARGFGNALMGPPGASRAILKLSESAPGFNESDGNGPIAKPLLRIWSRDDREPAPLDPAPPVYLPTKNLLAVNYNQTVTNIDIDLNRTAAHAGAAGMQLGLAQGGMVSDCAVTATGGLAGFYGSTGPGGGMYNLTVTGGQYGLFVPDDKSGLQALVTACTFTGQTTKAIRWWGASGLTVVGTNIKGTGIDMTTATTAPWNSMLCLVDSTIDLDSAGLAIATNRSVYMNRVHVRNGSPFITAHDGSSPDFTNTSANSQKGWIQVKEYAGGQEDINQFPAGGSTLSDVPRYANGTKITHSILAGAGIVEISNAINFTPPDYLPAHKMPATTWFLAANQVDLATGVVSVKDYGAVGDGIHDDTSAIQDAIDAAEAATPTKWKVFLPRGDYRLSEPLRMSYGTKFFGLHKNLTKIQSMYEEFVPGGAPYDFGDKTDPQPLIISNGGVNATCMISDLTLQQRINDAGSTLLQWKTGRNSVVKEVSFLRQPMGTTDETERATEPMILITGNGGGRFYNVWSGSDLVVNGSNFRVVQVTDITQPLAFYMLNCEYSHNNPLVEINNATGGVNIYQSKWEGNYVNLDIIDSDDVRVFGMGGNACAFPNNVASYVTAGTPPLTFGQNYQVHVTDTANFLIAGQSHQQRAPLPSYEGQPVGTYSGEWKISPAFTQPDRTKNDGVYQGVVGAAVNPSRFYRLRETVSGSDINVAGQEQYVLYKRGTPLPTIPD